MLTHFIISDDIARSRDFYANVLGGQIVSESPAVVALANSWIIINTGGGPTDDKPAVTLTAPDPDTTSSFLNIRGGAPAMRLALCSQQGANARERMHPAALPFARPGTVHPDFCG